MLLVNIKTNNMNKTKIVNIPVREERRVA